MKTKMLLTVSAVICVASAIAACRPTATVAGAQSSTYSAVEAAKHVGETATVTGRVDSFHQSGKSNIFLNMGGAYPKQAFTAFIPAGSASKFSNAQQYDGKTVAVTGKIQLYKGKPEIIVNSPSQISAQ